MANYGFLLQCTLDVRYVRHVRYVRYVRYVVLLMMAKKTNKKGFRGTPFNCRARAGVFAIEGLEGF